MCRPFENLRKLLESKSFPIAFCPVEKLSDNVVDVEPDHPDYEHRLFMAAMSDVRPLSKEKYIESKSDSPAVSDAVSDDDGIDCESLLKLKELVENGKGFVISSTPEYIEGTAYCDNPEITERLHRGDFSIQAHIDLHGFGADAAEDAFDEFIRHAIMTGKRAVLVVHGRGLSSPGKPVLKSKVQDWLTRGPLRKWIIAFSSARACDGGAGATYILLRNRPLTKRLRKRYKDKA